MSRLVSRLAVATLFVLILLVPTIPLRAAYFGREYSRCVHACNDLRLACDNRCDADCASTFVAGTVAFDACVLQCHGLCSDYGNDCKDICQAIKKYPYEEP